MPAENRNLARQAVVQTVFECEFRGMVEKCEDFLRRNLDELAEEKTIDQAFAKQLLAATYKYLAETKELISHYAPEWPFEKIALLDRVILHCGLAELKYLKDIPPSATLNEFIEIAKIFGGDSSRRFINGVLSAAKKDLTTDQ